ncbi:MAG: sigma-70 family RNA polymerase sigma factor [Oscillospiraceae bacterium]|nr:sigma-70 family RNA polymerase sigma factor [Oscillospiraceae bacterium]
MVRRAKSGDKAAFEELVIANQRGVYSLALRYTGNREDALDVSQEAFFRAYKGLAFFQGDCAFSTWLYRLTINAAIDALRRSKRKSAVPFSALGEPEQVLDIPDDRGAPDEKAELGELKEALAEALKTLSDEHRAVFILRAVHELSYTEIAEILDLEEGTVKSRLSRAREKLKQALEGNFSPSVSSNGNRKKSKGGGLYGS